MGAGAVRGTVENEIPGAGSLNPDHSSMSCESCHVSFNLFKRKLKCHDCGIHHCSSCVSKEANSKESRRCSKCKVLRSGSYTRHDLMHYKVRDLRSFLTRQNVPTNKCKEKEDLVDLAMLFCNSSQHFREEEEHQRHVRELQERHRITEEEFRPLRSNARSSSPFDSSQTQERNARNSATSQSSSVHPNTAETESQRLQRRQQEEMQATEERLHEELHTEDDIDPRPRRQHMTIDEVTQPQSIDDLNVRQLKEILAANFVDFKGCCEKPELIERVTRLYEERQRNKRISLGEGRSSPEESEMCKICMDAVIDCVLLDCGHMITCTTCGRRLNECPICRQFVVRVVHIFKA